jgi:pimeloyl-ACP methyl ester carboxylesterase
MRPFITFFIGITGLLYFTALHAQVYHFETGKIIPETSGQIIWKDGVFDNYPARFGTLVVKENRNQKQSRLIGIPVVYIPALEPDSHSQTIFTLNGGPGESNLSNILLFENVLQKHSLVMVGYRGVDGSVKLDCPCMLNALKSEKLNSNNATHLYQQALDSCLDGWQKQKIDIAGYSMPEVVADIEEVRRLMNLEKISFISFSFGSMIAKLYMIENPGKIQKCVWIAPRKLGDFNILPEDIINLSKQTDTFFDDVFDPDMLQVNYDLIENYLSSYDSIQRFFSQINHERFMIYLFSKLYAAGSMQELHIFWSKGNHGNWQPLVDDYMHFYKNYAVKLVMGDVIMKKQGFLSKKCALFGDTVLYADLLNPVNRWFNPNLPESNINNEIQLGPCVDSTPSLVICGDFDVVASPAIIQKHVLSCYIQCQLISLPLTGHLDLLTQQKNQVEELINDFFRK